MSESSGQIRFIQFQYISHTFLLYFVIIEVFIFPLKKNLIGKSQRDLRCFDSKKRKITKQTKYQTFHLKKKGKL